MRTCIFHLPTALSMTTMITNHVVSTIILVLSSLFQPATTFSLSCSKSSSKEVLGGESINLIPLGLNPQSVDWHRYCEDVDKNMEGLVSPSPESFHVVHLAMKRANMNSNRTANALYISIDDINALCQFLVKTTFSMELFHDDDEEIVKWRMNRGGNASLLYPDDYTTVNGGKELYHDYSTLQLSQLALELATNATNHDTERLSEIHEVTRQAQVSLSLSGALLYKYVSYSYNIFSLHMILSTETISFDLGLRLERAGVCRCMLQLRPRWRTESIKPIREPPQYKYS